MTEHAAVRPRFTDTARLAAIRARDLRIVIDENADAWLIDHNADPAEGPLGRVAQAATGALNVVVNEDTGYLLNLIDRMRAALALSGSQTASGRPDDDLGCTPTVAWSCPGHPHGDIVQDLPLWLTDPNDPPAHLDCLTRYLADHCEMTEERNAIDDDPRAVAAWAFDWMLHQGGESGR
jgi:hypothetical protein